MKIHRKDLTAPATVEFSGKFGEKPAIYTFTRKDPNDPRFTCEVKDEIAIQLLLNVEGYEPIIDSEEEAAEAQRQALAADIASGREPAPNQFPAAAESQIVTSTAAANPETDPGLKAARDYYFQTLQKRPGPTWDIKTIFDRLAADTLAKAQEVSNQQAAAQHSPSLAHLQSETAKHDVKQSSDIAQPHGDGRESDDDFGGEPHMTMDMPTEGVPSETAMAQGNGGVTATEQAIQTTKAVRSKKGD